MALSQSFLHASSSATDHRRASGGRPADAVEEVPSLQLPWRLRLGLGYLTGRLFLRQPVGPIDPLDEALQHRHRGRRGTRIRAGVVVATPEENGCRRRRLRLNSNVLASGFRSRPRESA